MDKPSFISEQCIMWVNKLQEVTKKKKTFIASKIHFERHA
jgi:hypothetical protein